MSTTEFHIDSSNTLSSNLHVVTLYDAEAQSDNFCYPCIFFQYRVLCEKAETG